MLGNMLGAETIYMGARPCPPSKDSQYPLPHSPIRMKMLHLAENCYDLTVINHRRHLSFKVFALARLFYLLNVFLLIY